MNTGYYDEDNIYISDLKELRLEIALQELLDSDPSQYTLDEREWLIEQGYNPDTGEYNE